MNTANEKLESILRSGYSFEFGDYMSRGYDLWKGHIGLFMGYGFVAGLIIMVASMIPVLGGLAAQLLLTPALTVGAYIVANRIAKNQQVAFGNFFDGFQKAGDIILASLVMLVIILLVMVPFFLMASGFFNWYVEMIQDPLGMAGTTPEISPLSFLFLIPVVYFAIAYMWAVPFIIFYDLKFWPALEMSRRFITKHWFMFFLFLMVTGILASLGIIGLFIGIFLTYPLYLCMQYAAFEDITELLEAEDEMERDLEDHLIV